MDDGNPTHYENRLTEDLGDLLGLSMDNVRRAELDEHARQRFPRIQGKEKKAAAARCRKLFDVEALVHALAAQLNGFNAESPAESLPRRFLDWAIKAMTEKHLVFDEHTCTRVEVAGPLALAIIEALFLGPSALPSEEMYRGVCLRDLFRPSIFVSDEDPVVKPRAKAEGKKTEGRAAGTRTPSASEDGKDKIEKAKKRKKGK